MKIRRITPVLLAICLTLALFPCLGLAASPHAFAASAPVGYWTFDQGSGTTAADSSGNSHTGTLQGSATWATGKVGTSALSLNGSSGADVDIPTPVVNTAQSFTAAAWVKLNSTSGYQTIMSLDGTQVSAFYLQLRADTGKFAFARLASDQDAAATSTAVALSAPATGMWYHLAGVYNASAQTLSLYVNGTLQQTVAYTSPWQGTGHTEIGRGKFSGNSADFANAQIDDARFYNTALVASDIQALATGSGGGTTASPAVSITSPATGTSYQAPASIVIQATAGITGSTISKVEFYNGSTLLNTTTTSPYTYTWSNVAAGSYSLTAKAYAANGTSTTSSAIAVAVNGTGSGQKEAACASGLPANTGTNYPTPNDPYGYGYYNQSIVGWEGNTYAPFAYLSGSFFARGVTASTYTNSGGTKYCGAMYSFGIYTYGLTGAPPAGSVQWTMDNGYLPALTTTFTRNNVKITIKNFADQVAINGNLFELVYSRISVTNNGTAAVTIDPQPSAGLTALNSVSNTVQAGQTANHDYVVAVDNFGTGHLLLPSGTTLTSAAPILDTAYTQMSTYWNGRLTVIPTVSLPNLTLPNTGLSSPGTALNNAYKSAFVYTRIIQVGTSPFSGANNYDAVFNHDAPGILVNRFQQGDFQDAHSLLLNARPSETNPYYFDGVLKTPWAWAVYLYETGDTSFVSQYFHDDASGANANGPSLYTMMHEIPGHLNAQGYIGVTGDNDSSGTWLFDDYSAMLGLSSYKYIAARIGNTTEATWADTQLTALINNTNTGLTASQQAHGYSYLSCEVNVADTADRCSAPSDSNWAANTFFGQDPWDLLLMGGNPTGLIGSGTQVDNTYDFGFGRLTGVLPYPTAGAFTGYSTAYNTTYGEGALIGTKYRDLSITSYAWQIANSMGGPNAWWEAETTPSANNPWAGSHAGPEFGAIPYAWPLAGQTHALLDSIVSEGFTTTTGGSSFSYTPALYIGRGIPNTWVASGQTISLGNITNTYNTSSGQRSTFGVNISTSLNSSSHRVVTVVLSGTPPSGLVQISLPAFNTFGVSQVTGGSYNATTHAVTATAGTTSITITLNS